MTYNETLKSLFETLAVANLADSDQSEPWQRSIDASQRDGLYGKIRSAIVDIAGEAIVEYWAETGEIDYGLANRAKPEGVESLEYKATGTLLGCMETTEAGVFVILVYRGSEYVVSRYRSGESEWFAGSYLSELNPALENFADQCAMWCS